MLEDGPLVERLADHPVRHVIPTSRRRGNRRSRPGSFDATCAGRGPALVHANGVKAALVCALAGAADRSGSSTTSAGTGDSRASSAGGARLVGVSAGPCWRPSTGTRSPDRGRAQRVSGRSTPTGGGAAAAPRGSRPARADGRRRDRRPPRPAEGSPGAACGASRATRSRAGPSPRVHGRRARASPRVRSRAPTPGRERGLEDSVTFLGYRDDAVELMSGCDAVLDSQHRRRERARAGRLPSHRPRGDGSRHAGRRLRPRRRAGARRAIAASLSRQETGPRFCMQSWRSWGTKIALAPCSLRPASGRRREFALPRFVAAMKERYREAANRAAMPGGSDVGRS